MTVSAVNAARVACDRVDGGQACASRLLSDVPGATEEQVRAAAAERGWGRDGDGDVCPKHQGSA